jgi:hypothetical protein
MLLGVGGVAVALIAVVFLHHLALSAIFQLYHGDQF